MLEVGQKKIGHAFGRKFSGLALTRFGYLLKKFLIGNRGFRGDPIDLLYPHYHSKGNDNPGYFNADVEKWIEQAQVEPDRIKRRRSTHR